MNMFLNVMWTPHVEEEWTSYSKTRNEIQQKAFVFYMVTFLPHIDFN